MAKILVVDDSYLMRNILTDELKRSGHEIIGEAADGNEALQIIDEKRPEIVFLDIILPGIIGLDILKIVTDKYPEIKVIVNSVIEDPSIENEVRQSGAVDFLLKPLTSQKIQNSLSKINL